MRRRWRWLGHAFVVVVVVENQRQSQGQQAASRNELERKAANNVEKNSLEREMKTMQFSWGLLVGLAQGRQKWKDSSDALKTTHSI